ncbi:MAG TPA: carboxypeptidase regulatory-like domain-containing protein [Dermatophilaceae bacterium]|jgi:hypothetical protein|nr:carboxypeptidase regulatory-like domain-containing protein [Dermatophilaceae bacterium]HMT89994.1 carboxypeptidase regulatory-like domain-containing protein [Dermatophilaceae bacterium]
MTPDESTLASEPLDTLDEQVLLTVRNMHARLDPVPSGLTDRIKFELTLAALHAEIAELQRVSLAGVRADDTAYAPTQSVTFTSSRLSLMVTLTAPTDDPDQARQGTITVDGWVTVAGTVVELRVGNLSLTVTADEHGRFVIEDVPHGPGRFVLHPPGEGERPIITPTVEL